MRVESKRLNIYKSDHIGLIGHIEEFGLYSEKKMEILKKDF